MVGTRSRRGDLAWPRRRSGSGAVVLSICVLLLAGCGMVVQSMSAPGPFVPSQAHSEFFGMTVNDFANVKPRVVFGTTRSWDGSPELDWADANPAAGQFNFTPLNRFI